MSKWLKRFWFIGFIVFILITPPPMPEAIASPASQLISPPDRSIRKQLPKLDLSADGVYTLSLISENSSLQYATWSTIAFQSLEYGSWDIFTTNGDGDVVRRITDDPAMDIQPRINIGCKRIVFASNRTGNYEIFSVNSDGTDIKQLTISNADDVSPAWSPDGTKIAFQTYRDGQAEIYVMNSDGSGQTRLTMSGGYDGQPTWSPDGSQIAFVSDRVDGSRIWIMQSNGTGQIKISNQPYSQNPAWSPTNEWIAFDADGDADGWQDLWLISPDGDPGTEHAAFINYQNETDYWMGGWSPDGKHIIITRIYFLFYNGQWYWTEALNLIIEITTGVAQSVDGYHLDWNPDWQTCDITPPHTTIGVLPQFLQNPATIRWHTDEYESGLSFMNIEVRKDDSDWENWLNTEDTNSSKDFFGVNGSTYCFRSRGVDNSRNWEPQIASDSKRCTTFYIWDGYGSVRDNRGSPVINADVNVIPTSFEIGRSNTAGKFALRVPSSSPVYTLSVTKTGYSTLPFAQVITTTEGRADFILPPLDNLIKDGGFEVGSLETNSWQDSGIMSPTLINGAGHTGNWVIGIGDVRSVNDLCVDQQLRYGCTYTSIIVALENAQPDQTVWVYPGIYKYEDGTMELDNGIRLKSVLGPDTTFLESTVALHSYGGAVIDGFTLRNMNIIAMNVGSRDGEFVILNNRFINNFGNGYHKTTGGLALRSYEEGYTRVLRNWFINNRAGNSSMDYPASLYAVSGIATISNNVFLNNLEGESAAVKLEYRSEGTFHNNTLVGNWAGLFHGRYYDVRNNIIVGSTSFGVSMDIGTKAYNNVWDNSPNYQSSDLTGIDGNISENPLFINTTDYDFRLQESSPSKDSGDPDNIYSDPDGSLNDMGAYGGPWALTSVDTYGAPIWQPTWYDITNWSGKAITVSFVISSTDSGGVLSSISQVITLTEELVNPTLSFVYTVREGYSGERDNFFVEVSDDAGATEEYLIGSYCGKVMIYIDEVSIGSAYPDVWVEVPDKQTFPGEVFSYSILYGNRSSIPVDGLLITDTISPEMTFFSASQPPISDTLPLIWEIGKLAANSGPYEIVVTTTMALTTETPSFITHMVSAAITSNVMSDTTTILISQKELETENNQVEAIIFVGSRIYLPNITRLKYEYWE